ncbi:MAG TPA: outer membrane beta-barrel protein [Verrucomicrobiae bacterium]|nr:outer membrane beta-barrel protein [Verrucomicrobiae bacterium]
MKKIMLALFACSILALGANAQDTPKANISGGWSMVHLNGSNGVSGVNLNGFSAAVTGNLNSWFGLVGDFGVYHGSPSGVGVSAESYTFGPRISFRHSDKFVPYVQGLFGGAHLSASFGGATGTSNPFAFGFGGGTDIAMTGNISFRPQFEYFGLRANSTTQNAERFSVAIVYNFGAK